MMTGYKIAALDDMLEVLGEDRVNEILANYSCPINSDIEDFLRHKAIPFTRQGLAKTNLVFACYQGRVVLAGYFTISLKTLFIRKSAKLSSNLRRRIRKFAVEIQMPNGYEISAPLIAQLGKNYADGGDKLISGDELLSMACDKVRNIQSLAGGKVAYLECEDKPSLIAFYERNGFVAFDKRPLDRQDRETFQADHLVQMLRYF